VPSKFVIPYDKLLPEIPDRRPWERPNSYLVKDESSADGWRIESRGRRPSDLLLIEKLRTAVDQWRDSGYAGASDVTERLFSYWFEEEHEVAEFPVPFRYHFCQRAAIETLVYLVEVFGKKDAKPLIEKFGRIVQQDLISKSVEFQTTIDGQRQIRRYVPEKQEVGIQDLPPKDLRRYAFKMATGSGKTWVMAMAVVWSYFHRKRISGSDSLGSTGMADVLKDNFAGRGNGTGCLRQSLPDQHPATLRTKLRIHARERARRDSRSEAFHRPVEEPVDVGTC